MRRLFITGIIVLFGCVGLQVWSALAYHHEASLLGKTLTSLLPPAGDGWSVEDVALGANEAATGRVEEILGFDQSVNRVYRNAELEVQVYAAYWTPGKMPYAYGGAHNPDSCWVNAGMTRTARDFAQTRTTNAGTLKAYEHGTYRNPATDKDIDVIWWHLVGGIPNRYSQQDVGWRDGIKGRIERIPLIVKDACEYGLDQRREQFFIRISSPGRIPWDDPRFKQLMAGLAPLGIFEATAPAAATKAP